MEIIIPFRKFYNTIQSIQDNDEQYPHILSRLEALQHVASSVQEKEPEKMSEDVRKGLEKLSTILESTKGFLERFNKTPMVLQAMKANNYKSEFENLNKSLTDAFVTLSAALHVHQEKTLEAQQGALDEQSEKLRELQRIVGEQDEKLVAQDKKRREQEARLARQERRLEVQEDKLAEQEDTLQSLETKVAYGSRAFYCVLL